MKYIELLSVAEELIIIAIISKVAIVVLSFIASKLNA